jgi:hypothetical protein
LLRSFHMRDIFFLSIITLNILNENRINDKINIYDMGIKMLLEDFPTLKHLQICVCEISIFVIQHF